MNSQRGLADERLAAVGAGNGRLPGVSCPVYDQLLAAEEALATEAAVQGFADGVREDVLLLGELADVARVSRLTVSSN